MITLKEVENIALLARLEIEESEKSSYQKDLSNILSLVEKINQMDLKNIEPTSHILNIQNIMREDKTKESLEQAKVLSNAPKQKDGFIVVPKVI